MNVKEQYWKYSLVTIIVVLGTILFVEFIPFLGGILGACTIYILVRKQMLYRFCVHICAPCTAILCVQGLSVSPEQWRKT